MPAALPAELADCFAEDGVLVVDDQHRFEGRAAILRLLEASGRRRDPNSSPTTHLVSGLLFERVTRERVDLRSSYALLTADGLHQWGRYADVLVPDGERWVFASRATRVVGPVSDSRPGG